MVFRIGDQVTLIKARPDEPYILEFQRYATVAARQPDGYIIQLSATMPPNERFGPFPESRLAPGWRDENGRWR